MTKKDRKTFYFFLLSFLLGSIITLVITVIVLKENNLIKNHTEVYEKGSLAPTIEKVANTVVTIEGYTDGTKSSTGSGFIYKKDHKYAYILTNEHVIKESIKITTSSNKEVTPQLVGKDAYLDIAILKIDKKYGDIATIGSSESSKVGDTVFTIGSPLGIDYKGSVTSGILSGKNRLVTTQASASTGTDCLINALQTDAPINPGNSGGPLFNVSGEVIGIITMKYAQDNIEGMGFAIPIEEAMKYLDILEKGKEIERPKLGITIVDVTDTSALLNNDISVTTDIKEGVLVTSSSIKQLEKGDIILKINDKDIRNSIYFKYELYQYKPQDKITITYLRDGKEKTTKVTLMAK